MHMFYRVIKGIYQFAANLLSYIPTKYYWNWSTPDLVIAKSKRVNFFLKHSVEYDDDDDDDLRSQADTSEPSNHKVHDVKSVFQRVEAQHVLATEHWCVRLSRLSHAAIESRLMNVGLCGFHRRVAQSL